MDHTYTSYTENGNCDFHGVNSITFGHEGMTSTFGQKKIFTLSQFLFLSGSIRNQVA